MGIKKVLAIFTLTSALFVGTNHYYVNEIEKSEVELEEARKEIKDLEYEQELKDSEIAKLEDSLKNNEKDIEKLDSKLDEALEENETLKEENDKLKSENEKLKEKSDSKQSESVGKSKNFNESAKNRKYHSRTMIVTAYTAGYESTQKKKGDEGYGITASGTTVAEGRTIACPNSIPFGTVIHIEGVGDRVCEDRGGAIVDGHLDLYVEDLNKAREFGRQELKVKIFD